MKQLNNNKQVITKNSKRRIFFILIGGIIILITLLGIIFLIKKTGSKNKQSEKNFNSETELTLNLSSEDKNCPYLNESELTTIPENKRYSKLKISDEDLTKWRQIPQDFIVKCWKKGYHWHDILQLREWKISETEIPNPKAKQRIGVINSLAYSVLPPAHILFDETISREEKERIIREEKFGLVRDLVVIVRKVTSGGGINLSKGICGASPFGNTQKYAKKLISFILNQENQNPDQHEIFLLSCIGTDQLDEGPAFNVIGKSFGSAAYLALLSALHQKPIAKSVASTGVINTSQKKNQGKINDQEINLVPGDNLPIAGLNGKTRAAVEKGVKYLVLSAYNNPPDFLSQNRAGEWKVAENYSKAVPAEIREKIKVYWAKNISELKDILFQGKLG